MGSVNAGIPSFPGPPETISLELIAALERSKAAFSTCDHPAEEMKREESRIKKV